MSVSGITSGTTVSTRIVGADQKSPVQRMLATANKPKQSQEPYTEQDWYLNMKVNQLRMQLDFYSRMPPDLGNPIMDGLEKEIRDLVVKQQAKIKDAREKADAEKKKLDEAQKPDRFADIPTPEQMLERSAAKVAKAEAQRGSTFNRTA